MKCGHVKKLLYRVSQLGTCVHMFVDCRKRKREELCSKCEEILRVAICFSSILLKGSTKKLTHTVLVSQNKSVGIRYRFLVVLPAYKVL